MIQGNDTPAAQATKILKEGGIVIFPTDTAFGIGCRMDSRTAVDRLFEIRKRPLTQATPVLVASVDQALPYLNTPSDVVRRLMEQYWPGALTIVTVCNTEMVYSPVRGGTETIGVRMPDHPELLGIIQSVGVPVLGPSANIHGGKTPFSVGELDEALVRQVDFVLPGSGNASAVSTVVDCTTDPYVIIRQGGVVLPRNQFTLFIDASETHEIRITLRRDSGEKTLTVASVRPSSERILPMVRSLLAETHTTLEDLGAIEVHPGPGSFTGLRVGAAIGMMLGWLLNIPVNGKRADAPVDLTYAQDRWQ